MLFSQHWGAYFESASRLTGLITWSEERSTCEQVWMGHLLTWMNKQLWCTEIWLHLRKADASLLVDLLLVMHNRVIPRQLQETEIKASVRIVVQICIFLLSTYCPNIPQDFSHPLFRMENQLLVDDWQTVLRPCKVLDRDKAHSTHSTHAVTFFKN